MLWVMIPTKFPEKYAKIRESWKQLGYRIAVCINENDTNKYEADCLIKQEWKGVANAYNSITQYLLGGLDFTGVIAAADDISTTIPAAWYEKYFKEKFPNGFGIIQPKKNCFNLDCAESALIGKAFIQLGYNGAGAFNERYGHWFCDSELELMAVRMNCYIADHTIEQPHDQWRLHTSEVPKYVQRTYEQDKLYFESRKRALLKMGPEDVRKDFIMDLNTKEKENGNSSSTESNKPRRSIFRQRSKRSKG